MLGVLRGILEQVLQMRMLLLFVPSQQHPGDALISLSSPMFRGQTQWGFLEDWKPLSASVALFAIYFWGCYRHRQATADTPNTYSRLSMKNKGNTTSKYNCAMAYILEKEMDQEYKYYQYIQCLLPEDTC